MSSILKVKEIPILSLRLQIQLQAYGIKLDTSKFETMIEEDNDISNVIKVCGELLFSEEEDESDDEDSVDSALTFDFEGFCNKMAKQITRAEKKAVLFERKAGKANMPTQVQTKFEERYIMMTATLDELTAQLGELQGLEICIEGVESPGN